MEMYWSLLKLEYALALINLFHNVYRLNGAYKYKLIYWLSKLIVATIKTQRDLILSNKAEF